jgi:MFS family permease
MSKVFDRINRRRGVWVGLFLMTLIYIFSYFQRVAIPGTIFNQLQHDLILSSAEVALLGGLFLYVYGGMQVFAGMLVDRFGPMRVILAGGILLSVGSILFPLSHSLWMLYATRIVVGLGASVMFISLVKELDLRFSDNNFSALLGIMVFAGYAGGLMGTRPFDAAATAFGWRTALLWVGVGTAVVVAISALVFRGLSEPERDHVAQPLLPVLANVLKNRLCYPAITMEVIGFANYFVFQGIIGKKFLEDCCGLASSTAASWTLLLSFTCMTSVGLSGVMSRLIGNRRKPILILSSLSGVLAPCTGLLILGRGSQWILPCFLLFGISGGTTQIVNSSIKELNQPEFVGSAVGVANGATYLGVAVFATLAGLGLDHFASHAVRTATAIHYPMQAYRTILLGCLFVGVIAFVSSLLVRETSGKNMWAHD